MIELPETAIQWIDFINKADPGRLVRLMTPDHTFYVQGEPPTIGPDANESAWRGYFGAFPNYRIYIDRVERKESDSWYLLGHTSGSHVPHELESQPESVIWEITLAESLVSRWIIYDGECREALGIQAKSDQAE